MYLSRDVEFTLCYLSFLSERLPQYYDVTAWEKKEGVSLSSHKTTVPMNSLLLAGTVLCVKDPERNKIKLSCVLSWIYWKPPVCVWQEIGGRKKGEAGRERP